MKFRIIASVVYISAALRGASEPPDLRLLDLNVVALDQQGQPVTDLTADDFQIVDAGKPQKISFFRRNGAGARYQQVPALGPNELSNRAPGGSPNAVVILFDMLNMGSGARENAANEMVRQLGEFAPADSLYLYLLSVNGKFFTVRGISPVSESSLQPPGAPWTRQIKPLMDKGLRAVMGFRSPDMDVFTRTQMTFAALEALGGQLASVPGRKIVVWVTDGVPVALGDNRSDIGLPVDFTPLIRQLSEVFERSNVALYPVRQTMLGSPDDIGANSDGAGATGGAGTGLQSIETLNLFANLTGGRRSTDRNIGAVVQQAVKDLRFSYRIGYYARPGNWDDKFHKLRVTSKRKGLKIQAKTGYYAWKTTAGSHTQEAFTAVTSAPFDAEGIGLRATVSADADNADARLVNLRIDARDIALAQQGDDYVGHLGITWVDYQANGLITPGPGIPVDVQYTAAQLDQALRNGIAVTEKLTASEGESRFRVMVFDRGSNAVGSITIPAAAVRQAPR